jgi:hypothetical protein
MGSKADLTNVRLKIARAKQKLDDLSAKVAQYLDPPPYRLVVETDGDKQAIVCRIDREPDTEWALELAEVAYQARSALDLLIVQLVVDSGNTPRRGTGFPIFTSRDDYMTKGRGRKSPRDKMLDGVASRHRKVIDTVQPYHRGRSAPNDPLAVLNTVSNRDKHGDIYTGIAIVNRPRFQLIRTSSGGHSSPEDLTVEFPGNQLNPYLMIDGQRMVAIDTAGLLPHEHIQLEVPETDIELGFISDGRAVTLAQIEQAVLGVSSIIDKFEARISK